MNQRKNGLSQEFGANRFCNQQPCNPHSRQPSVMQPKTPFASQTKTTPAAPSTYRPQSASNIAQPKMANAAQQNRQPPVALPVYRPQPAPKVLQTKTPQAKPLAPGARPLTAPASVAQAKMAGARPGVIQSAQTSNVHSGQSGLLSVYTGQASAGVIQPVRKKPTGEGTGNGRGNAKKTPAKEQSGVKKREHASKVRREEIKVSKQKVQNVKKVVKKGKIAGRTAANAIVSWLSEKGYGGATNYTVGVLSNGDLMISKVGGVGEGAVAIIDLKEEIKEQGYNIGRNIYLAQKFSPQAASNHSEMCILAAATALKRKVSYMKCTGDHCPYCAETMRHYGVERGNNIGTVSQAGWAHPSLKLFYGTQLSATVTQKAMVAELNQVHQNLPNRIAISYSGTVTTEPQGKSTIIQFL